jgi:hypothetical protein
LSLSLNEILEERAQMLESLNGRLDELAEVRKDRDAIALLLKEQISTVEQLLTIEKSISEAIRDEISAQTAHFGAGSAEIVSSMEDSGKQLGQVLKTTAVEVGAAAEQVRASVSEAATDQAQHRETLREANKRVEAELRATLGEAVALARTSAAEISEQLSSGITAMAQDLSGQIESATVGLRTASATMETEIGSLQEGISKEEGRFSEFMIEKRASITALMSVVDDNAKRLAESLLQVDRSQGQILGDLAQLGDRAKQIVDTMSELENQSRDVSTGIGKELTELVRDEVRSQMGRIEQELIQIRETLGKRKFII